MLEAYAAGVNAFVEATAALPAEYGMVGGTPEPWEAWHSLAVFKVRHIMMGSFEGKLWRARLLRELGPEKAARIMPGYQPGHLVIVPPGGVYEGPAADPLEELRQSLEAVNWMDVPDSGSNNWVLSGSRTASGKPLLAGDPHRPLDTPNVYYQNHVACPEFDVVGLSFPGVPGFPHFGHNATVAWCVTHAMADYQDLYLERFDKDDATRYESADGWKPAEVRHERIEVRDGDAVELDVTVTGHGPIVAGDPAEGYGIAFRYTATDGPNHGSEALLPMLRASNIDALDEAMRPWVDPCNNFLFADVEGSIGYLTRGSIPLRPMANAWLPVPGWTSEYEWRGAIPFEELPRSRNPETGYIVTANNRITAADYPHYINLDFAPEFRARRIIARLEALQKATVADMAAIHAERLSIPNQTYARLLAGVSVGNGLVAQAQARLAAWEGAMERNSVEPTIASAFRIHLDRRGRGAAAGAAGGGGVQRHGPWRARARGTAVGAAAAVGIGGRDLDAAAGRDAGVGAGAGAEGRRGLPAGPPGRRHGRLDLGGRARNAASPHAVDGVPGPCCRCWTRRRCRWGAGARRRRRRASHRRSRSP